MKRADSVGRVQHTALEATLVIPQRNHVRLTVECVASIRNTDPKPWPILVVDDASDPFDALEPFGYGKDQTSAPRSSLRILRHERQRGVTAAWNTGARHAETSFVLWLNNDVIAEGPWVEQLLRPLVAGSAEVTGARWRTERTVDQDLLNRHGGSRFLEGWCFATRRTSWEDLGGFDEAMAVYWGDTDFFVRARKHGMRLGVVNELPLRHLGHRTAHDPSCLSDRHRHWQRDRATFLRKLRAKS